MVSVGAWASSFSSSSGGTWACSCALASNCMMLRTLLHGAQGHMEDVMLAYLCLLPCGVVVVTLPPIWFPVVGKRSSMTRTRGSSAASVGCVSGRTWAFGLVAKVIAG